MTNKRTRKSKGPIFADLFKPVSINIANDVIIGNDGLMSIIKLMDKVNATGFPITIHKIVIVTEFDRNMNYEVDEIAALRPSLFLTVVNPAGEEIEFGEAEVSVSRRTDLPIQRAVFDISGVVLKNKGTYSFKAYGATLNSKKEELLARNLILDLVAPAE